MAIRRIGRSILIGFGVLFGASLILSLVREARVDPIRRAAQDSAHKAEMDKRALDYAAIELAEKGVRTILKDGDSAKFRDASVAQWIDQKPVVCGYVNSKNSFGAYIGDTEFAVFNGLASINDHNHKEFVTVWNTLCVADSNSSNNIRPTLKSTNR